MEVKTNKNGVIFTTLVTNNETSIFIDNGNEMYEIKSVGFLDILTFSSLTFDDLDKENIKTIFKKHIINEGELKDSIRKGKDEQFRIDVTTVEIVEGLKASNKTVLGYDNFSLRLDEFKTFTREKQTQIMDAMKAKYPYNPEKSFLYFNDAFLTDCWDYYHGIFPVVNINDKKKKCLINTEPAKPIQKSVQKAKVQNDLPSIFNELENEILIDDEEEIEEEGTVTQEIVKKRGEKNKFGIYFYVVDGENNEVEYYILYGKTLIMVGGFDICEVINSTTINENLVSVEQFNELITKNKLSK